MESVKSNVMTVETYSTGKVFPGREYPLVKVYSPSGELLAYSLCETPQELEESLDEFKYDFSPTVS